MSGANDVAAQRLTVALADQRATAEARGAAACAVLETVCAALQRLPLAEGAADAPADAVLIAAGDGFSLLFEGATEHCADAFLAHEALMRALTRRILWSYGTGLALHAGALDSGQGVWLFPAVSGSGKSTLSVDFALRGMACLSDELVFVPSVSAGGSDGGSNADWPSCLAWSRPAHTKRGSKFLLDEHAAALHGKPVLRSAHGDLFPLATLNAPADPWAPRRITRVVAPHYDPLATRVELVPLSAGQTSAVLLGSLVNARNLAGLGVAQVTALAKQVAGYRLRYAELHAAHAALCEQPVT